MTYQETVLFSSELEPKMTYLVRLLSSYDPGWMVTYSVIGK
jgi:hypothetical protein